MMRKPKEIMLCPQALTHSMAGNPLKRGGRLNDNNQMLNISQIALRRNCAHQRNGKGIINNQDCCFNVLAKLGIVTRKVFLMEIFNLLVFKQTRVSPLCIHRAYSLH